MNRVRHKLPSKWEEREKLRSKGQFWTPDWVAKAMVSYVMQPESKILFDPAVGNGAFLDAFQSIKSGHNKFGFYGIDIDETLLEKMSGKGSWCRVEKKDFILDPPNKKFSSIVANPPYIRHHRLSREVKSVLREISIQNLGTTLDGRAGIHIYFLVQALSLLAPGGRLSFIMPADTCEGVFATKLWKWITHKFRLEAVITFDPEATPFPGVDTNALVFMIENAPPQHKLQWIRCKKSPAPELPNMVRSGFRSQSGENFKIVTRDLDEALNTGLSRNPTTVRSNFNLSDFARVMRGVATGSNQFFWLTVEQAETIGIPQHMLKTTVGRTRDVPNDCLTKKDIKELALCGRPTLLFAPDGRPLDQFPVSVRKYLEAGERIGINNRALIKTRNPWYKMEKRTVPPLLFAYLGRRRVRFIRNQAGAIPLTGFLCVYPHAQFSDHTDELWRILNAKETMDNLPLVGKSYGAGAIKVEPRSLERLPIPDAVIDDAFCDHIKLRSRFKLT